MEGLCGERASEVLFDPRARMRYAWFYLRGMADAAGSVRAASRAELRTYFPALSQSTYYSVLPLLVNTGERNAFRAIIDFHDSGALEPAALDWADLYAKVNLPESLNVQRLDGGRPIIVSLGPGFGVGPATPPESQVLDALAGALIHPRVGGINLLRQRVADDLRWVAYPPLGLYTAGESDPNFVYYSATEWYHDTCRSTTNPERAAFMRAAANHPSIRFEGGFFAPKRTRTEFPDLAARNRVSMRDWVRLTSRSAVVFNNPAVHGCLGWKLGQYLALGKAIISLPLGVALPSPLEHGRSCHFVSDSEGIPDAVQRILDDHSYRGQLERGARDYWQRHAHPQRVALRMLEHARRTC